MPEATSEKENLLRAIYRAAPHHVPVRRMNGVIPGMVSLASSRCALSQRSRSRNSALVDSTASLAFVSELGVSERPVLDVTGLKVERELGLIWRRGRALSPAAAAFAEELCG